jgi:hypothetical protein
MAGDDFGRKDSFSFLRPQFILQIFYDFPYEHLSPLLQSPFRPLISGILTFSPVLALFPVSPSNGIKGIHVLSPSLCEQQKNGLMPLFTALGIRSH